MAPIQPSGAILRYHSSLLGDSVRTDAFRRAINEVVRPGDIVVDLGTGTGILALFAAQAGAGQVYAIDHGQVVALARELFAANGVADRIERINKPSFGVDLPQRGDVLVTETLWNFGLGEGMVGFVIDARERFLKSDARIVPRTIEIMMVPVSASRAYRRVAIWSEVYGVDLSAVRDWASDNWYLHSFERDQFLAAPAVVDQIDLGTVATDAGQGGTGSFRVETAGTLHGFAGWFRSQLSPSVDVSNEPPNQTPSWSHVFFPLKRAVDVREGDSVSVEIQSTANGSVWRWRTQVESSMEEEPLRFDQSSFFGFPPAFDQQSKRADDHRPKLSRRGEAELYVLQSFDGSRSIEAIEDDVKERFSDVFRREVEVSHFVRAQAEKYS